MTEMPGWTFADEAAIEWQPMGDGVAIKTLAVANGRMFAMFKFDPGYVGGSHDHADAEFTYVLTGDIVSNGVTMLPGHGYGAEAGTSHTEFRSENGATLVSVFAVPGS